MEHLASMRLQLRLIRTNLIAKYDIMYGVLPRIRIETDIRRDLFCSADAEGGGYDENTFYHFPYFLFHIRYMIHPNGRHIHMSVLA